MSSPSPSDPFSLSARLQVFTPLHIEAARYPGLDVFPSITSFPEDGTVIAGSLFFSAAVEPQHRTG